MAGTGTERERSIQYKMCFFRFSSSEVPVTPGIDVQGMRLGIALQLLFAAVILEKPLGEELFHRIASSFGNVKKNSRRTPVRNVSWESCGELLAIESDIRWRPTQGISSA